MSEPEKMFPIQGCPPIPWRIAMRAYHIYTRFFGHQQSMERLAERGGFGLQEFACLFEGHSPISCDRHRCLEKAVTLAYQPRGEA